MNRRDGFVIGLILVAVLYFGGHVVAAGLRHNAPQRPAQVIQEDDPGWDCATMGNRICGPQR